MEINNGEERIGVEQKKFNPLLKIASILERGQQASVSRGMDPVKDMVIRYLSSKTTSEELNGGIDTEALVDVICLAELGHTTGISASRPESVEGLAKQIGGGFKEISDGLMKLEIPERIAYVPNVKPNPSEAPEGYQQFISADLSAEALIVAGLLQPLLAKVEARLPYVNSKEELLKLAGISIASNFINAPEAIIAAANDPSMGIDELSVTALAELGEEASKIQGAPVGDIVTKYFRAIKFKEQYIQEMQSTLKMLDDEKRGYQEIANGLADELSTEWGITFEIPTINGRDDYIRLIEWLRNPDAARFKAAVMEQDGIFTKLKGIRDSAVKERRNLRTEPGMDYTQLAKELVGSLNGKYGIALDTPEIKDRAGLDSCLKGLNAQVKAALNVGVYAKGGAVRVVKMAKTKEDGSQGYTFGGNEQDVPLNSEGTIEDVTGDRVEVRFNFDGQEKIWSLSRTETERIGDKALNYNRVARKAAGLAEKMAWEYTYKWQDQRKIELKQQIRELNGALKSRRRLMKNAAGDMIETTQVPLKSGLEAIIKKADSIAQLLEKAEVDIVEENLPLLRAFGLGDSMIKDYLGMYISNDVLDRYIASRGTLEQIEKLDMGFDAIAERVYNSIRDNEGLVLTRWGPQYLKSLGGFERFKECLPRAIAYSHKALKKPNLMREDEVVVYSEHGNNEVPVGTVGIALEYKEPNVRVKIADRTVWIHKEALAPAEPGFAQPELTAIWYEPGAQVMFRGDAPLFAKYGNLVFTIEDADRLDDDKLCTIKSGETLLKVDYKQLEITKMTNKGQESLISDMKWVMETARPIAEKAIAEEETKNSDVYRNLDALAGGLIKSLTELGVPKEVIGKALEARLGNSSYFVRKGLL